MASLSTLPFDAMAGATAACIALPLNIAIALASGLPASIGIITGVVAGVLAGFLGGARLQITGPEAAMIPIVAEIVRTQGLAGLEVAGFIVGCSQIVLGFSRVGFQIRRIPKSVVHGFMAGIGLLIIAVQLPVFLGLPQDTKISQLFANGKWLTQIDGVSVVLASATLIAIVALSKIPRLVIPPLMVTLLLVTGAVVLLSLDVKTVGALPASLPVPTWPDFHRVDFLHLLPHIVSLVLLASMGSLLSAVALDSMVKDHRSDMDQELVAQGCANLACAAFGALPVMGAIVRSSVAVQAGARTRAASIFQALLLFLLVVVAAPFVQAIPIVALASVLIVVGFRLINPSRVVETLRSSWQQGAVLLVSALTIAVFGFVWGIAAGIALSLAFAGINRSRERTRNAVIPILAHNRASHRLSLQPHFAAAAPELNDERRAQ